MTHFRTSELIETVIDNVPLEEKVEILKKVVVILVDTITQINGSHSLGTESIVESGLKRALEEEKNERN